MYTCKLYPIRLGEEEKIVVKTNFRTRRYETVARATHAAETRTTDKITGTRLVRSLISAVSGPDYNNNNNENILVRQVHARVSSLVSTL